jgi:hypothetical protein
VLERRVRCLVRSTSLASAAQDRTLCAPPQRLTEGAGAADRRTICLARNCIAALCGNSPYAVDGIRPSMEKSIAQIVQPLAHGALHRLAISRILVVSVH